MVRHVAGNTGRGRARIVAALRELTGYLSVPFNADVEVIAVFPCWTAIPAARHHFGRRLGARVATDFRGLTTGFSFIGPIPSETPRGQMARNDGRRASLLGNGTCRLNAETPTAHCFFIEAR